MLLIPQLFTWGKGEEREEQPGNPNPNKGTSRHITAWMGMGVLMCRGRCVSVNECV